MDAEEVEFVAEKCVITILPNFSENRVYMIGGDYGPFNPSLPVDVPLWLAVHLKKRQKCRVRPPDWLAIEPLTEKKREEGASELFTPMPSDHYMEVAMALLNNASDDVQDADQVRTLIKDIWDIRVAKLRKSIDQMIRSQAISAELTNLTLMEINTIRPFLTKALDHLHMLRVNAEEHASEQT
ncbi:DNA replication complex GINS protein PSF2-like [Corticium candelabrum]|uniref:DNA replication complex GINS protein PSF2-like n=1 Tax=Corticium candelabrum TaxID=121492 RepID=UPI002E260865|nr:DNA replication complex GINS protein PSF2-like [Corticium candelabrum]